MKDVLKIAVVGANGYTGGELLRLLANHPNVKTTTATSRSQSNQAIATVFPSLQGCSSLPDTFVDFDAQQVAGHCDLAFTCLPHGDAQHWVADLVKAGTAVIDLSADYRYNDIRTYEKAYVPHAFPELAANAVYGLVEWNRDAIKSASLIANPGCYPTSVLLGLLPLAKERMVTGQIIVDSQSAVSGAGRTAKTNLLHGEVSESLQAYGIPQHRHESEMIYQLEDLGGLDTDLIFTPHLAPINRGILSTIHIELTQSYSESRDCLTSAYNNEPFVELLPEGELPRTSSVRGSNRAQLQLVKRKGKFATVICVIDNLCKGAAGQAVQNMNVNQGFEETTGLEQFGLTP